MAHHRAYPPRSYVFERWIGDDEPRHVHVSDGNGNLLGRIALADFSPLDDCQPVRKVIEVLQQLKAEGRLLNSSIRSKRRSARRRFHA